jgi:hypothetical protein
VAEHTGSLFLARAAAVGFRWCFHPLLLYPRPDASIYATSPRDSQIVPLLPIIPWRSIDMHVMDLFADMDPLSSTAEQRPILTEHVPVLGLALPISQPV